MRTWFRNFRQASGARWSVGLPSCRLRVESLEDRRLQSSRFVETALVSDAHCANHASFLPHLEGRSMHSLLRLVCVRSLYPLVAIVALTASAQAAGPVPGSRMANRGMSRPQLPRTVTMPAFSPNPSLNLGLVPLLGAYGMGRSQQTGRINPYGSGTPYSGSSGYGMSQGYTQGYGDSVTGAPAGPERYTAESQPSPEERSLSSLLTASGVPNDNGRLRWPLGLLILAAPETGELRQRIEALFQEAASQTAGGPVSSPLIQEMGQAVDKFRRLLLKDKAERLGMPLSVYGESERFLDRLEHAEQVLKPGVQTSGAQGLLKTTVPSTSYPSTAPLDGR
jgi:hypothetical protein